MHLLHLFLARFLEQPIHREFIKLSDQSCPWYPTISLTNTWTLAQVLSDPLGYSLFPTNRLFLFIVPALHGANLVYLVVQFMIHLEMLFLAQVSRELSMDRTLRGGVSLVEFLDIVSRFLCVYAKLINKHLDQGFAVQLPLLLPYLLHLLPLDQILMLLLLFTVRRQILKLLELYLGLVLFYK